MTKDSQAGVNVGGPMQDLDDWEEVLRERYPAPGAESEQQKEEFRNYESSSRPSVREFYRLNHRHQTLAFVLAKKLGLSPGISAGQVRIPKHPGRALAKCDLAH